MRWKFFFIWLCVLLLAFLAIFPMTKFGKVLFDSARIGYLDAKLALIFYFWSWLFTIIIIIMLNDSRNKKSKSFSLNVE